MQRKYMLSLGAVALVVCILALLVSGVPIQADRLETHIASTEPRQLSPKDLFGVTYVLDKSVGFKPVENTRMELAFVEGKGTKDLLQSVQGGFRIWFNADCNSARGVVKLAGGRLVSLDGLMVTEMGCDGPRHRQDDWLIKFFMGNPKITLDGPALTIESKEATLHFLDKKVADPDRPLVGNLWTAQRIIKQHSVGWMQMDAYPTLNFSSDGALTIFDGCNELKGRFAVNATHITLTAMTPMTMNMCAGDHVQEMSAHYAKVFANGTLSYAIDSRSLKMKRGSDGIVAYTD